MEPSEDGGAERSFKWRPKALRTWRISADLQHIAWDDASSIHLDHCTRLMISISYFWFGLHVAQAIVSYTNVCQHFTGQQTIKRDEITLSLHLEHH